MRGESHIVSRLVVAISLVATPLMIFVSTSVPMFLANQTDLGYQTQVLYPFLTLALLTSLVGIFIWRFAKGYFGGLVLWLYYLAGPLFLLFAEARTFPSLDQPIGSISFLLGSLGLAVVLAKIIHPTRLAGFFAMFGILIAATSAFQMIMGTTGREDYAASSPSLEKNAVGDTASPNIYHVVLDGFQSDIFSLILDNTLARKLGGFTYFREATALYSHTVWSIPSVFGSKEYDFSTTQTEYQESAFNGKQSVLTGLKNSGYETIAYTRKLYPFELQLFDRTIQHVDNVKSEQLENESTFISAWIYRYSPPFVQNWFAAHDILLTEDDIAQFKEGVFLPASAPLESVLSFRQFLSDEATLPAAGRYTFIHLLIPHGPYVFDTDCREVTEATPVAQSSCAMKLMVQLIETLKKLQRFEESTIIIHGDHGDHYVMQDGALVPAKQRSPRTLILVKPGGADDSKAFEISNAKVTLLDIAPTIQEAAQQERNENFAGSSLLRSEVVTGGTKQRHYFVVRNKESMRKYRIDDSQLHLVEEIKLPDSPADSLSDVPVFRSEDVIEAEDGLLSDAVDVLSALPGASGSYVANGRASYAFNIPKDGKYRLKIRAITPSGNNDSSFLSLDDEKPIIWDMTTSSKWKWQQAPVEWLMRKGTSIVTLDYREPIYMDQLQLVEVTE